MEWEDLRYFLAVARRQSLAAAARDLKVSQATVWRHVARLEQSLQVRLFAQRSTGYILSAAGEGLQESAQRVEAEIQAAKGRLSSNTAKLRGEVRLTTPELVAGLLAANLQMLRMRHPELCVEMVTSTPTAALSRRETDIALRYEAAAHGSLVIEHRFAVGFGIYASPGYIRKHGRPTAVDHFNGHALIGFDDSAGHVAPARWLRKGGQGARITFRSNSLQARFAAAKSGVGCALLPAMLGDGDPELVQVFSERAAGSLELYLFVNGRVTNSPNIAAVRSFIVSVLESRKQALTGRG